MAMQDVNDIVDDFSGRSRRVLEYCMTTKRLVDAAKRPGFSVDSWTPLAGLVAIDEFERVGPFKEVMKWPEYVDFLTNWATSSEWECSFKRITEPDGVVFLELEERSTVGDFSNVVNSLSVYEFDSTGLIRRIDVYLQMVPLTAEMLNTGQ
jgi:hypothetical protein